MKDKLTFPTFTHDSIAGYCNDKPLYAQYKKDKKSKYIGTKQMWQELSKLQDLLYITNSALVDAQLYLMHDTNMSASEVLEHIIYAGNCVGHGGEIYKRKKTNQKKD